MSRAHISEVTMQVTMHNEVRTKHVRKFRFSIKCDEGITFTGAGTAVSRADFKAYVHDDINKTYPSACVTKISVWEVR